jgi:hypothetical protein
MPRYTSSDKFSALNPFDEDALVPDLERFVRSAMVVAAVDVTMGGAASETSGGRTIKTTSCGIGNRVHIRVQGCTGRQSTGTNAQQLT